MRSLDFRIVESSVGAFSPKSVFDWKYRPGLDRTWSSRDPTISKEDVRASRIRNSASSKSAQVLYLEVRGCCKLEMLRVVSHEYEIARKVRISVASKARLSQRDKNMDVMLFRQHGLEEWNEFDDPDIELERMRRAIDSCEFYEVAEVEFGSNEETLWKGREEVSVRIAEERFTGRTHYVRIEMIGWQDNAWNQRRAASLVELNLFGSTSTNCPCLMVGGSDLLAFESFQYSGMGENDLQSDPVAQRVTAEIAKLERQVSCDSSGVEIHLSAVQEALVSVGIPLDLVHDLSPSKTAVQITGEAHAVLSELRKLKDALVEDEEFEEAISVKKMIAQLVACENRVQELEVEKKLAVMKEDFDNALQVKTQMQKLEAFREELFGCIKSGQPASHWSLQNALPPKVVLERKSSRLDQLQMLGFCSEMDKKLALLLASPPLPVQTVEGGSFLELPHPDSLVRVAELRRSLTDAMMGILGDLLVNCLGSDDWRYQFCGLYFLERELQSLVEEHGPGRIFTCVFKMLLLVRQNASTPEIQAIKLHLLVALCSRNLKLPEEVDLVSINHHRENALHIILEDCLAMEHLLPFGLSQLCRTKRIKTLLQKKPDALQTVLDKVEQTANQDDSPASHVLYPLFRPMVSDAQFNSQFQLFFEKSTLVMNDASRPSIQRARKASHVTAPLNVREAAIKNRISEAVPLQVPLTLAEKIHDNESAISDDLSEDFDPRANDDSPFATIPEDHFEEEKFEEEKFEEEGGNLEGKEEEKVDDGLEEKVDDGLEEKVDEGLEEKKSESDEKSAYPNPTKKDRRKFKSFAEPDEINKPERRKFKSFAEPDEINKPERRKFKSFAEPDEINKLERPKFKSFLEPEEVDKNLKKKRFTSFSEPGKVHRDNPDKRPRFRSFAEPGEQVENPAPRKFSTFEEALKEGIQNQIKEERGPVENSERVAADQPVTEREENQDEQNQEEQNPDKQKQNQEKQNEEEHNSKAEAQKENFEKKKSIRETEPIESRDEDLKAKKTESESEKSGACTLM